MIRIYAVAGFIAFFSSSCERAIKFNLNKSNPQLVVDGSIENDKYPVVVLSNSLDYFSQITPEILSQSFVHKAGIFVSNGTDTVQLKEYSSLADSNGDRIYYYTVDSAYLASTFKGGFLGSYSLRIVANGQTYTAQTTIPALTKKIDSLWYKNAASNSNPENVILVAKITDPPGYGNYIRYFTSENNGLFYPGLNSVFDDQIVDGTTYDIPVDKGVDRNLPIDFANYAFFKRGDTAIVKFCNIDKITYDFWRTMEYNYQSIGNPFSSPTKTLGNISNNGLGYFGGYGAQYVTLMIPK